ncbi:radical SAM protein [Halalkaliarchaeum desulfuricum]|uniref:Radical SAM protein n=1 Tax=Halalkaliarchaeum desulfuricum TaxID=2055893 RepID=A0A343TMH1_9EURY|nr:TIGR04053 family radical SAM/SPASM domain-containing protein [Halalkaliarchaeum desulfuricum]AUX10293.1 radical SAM protein [Halalkaliarchaeum desulfuricum]
MTAHHGRNANSSSHPHANQSEGSGSSDHPHSNRSSDSDGHPGARDYSESPLVVTWEVSQACDLTCDHCRAEANTDRDQNELSTAEGIELFEQVAEFSPQPFMVLSGGDPLKRPDIFELLEGAVEAGVTPSITPATTSLLDRETIERFADIGIGRMALSLDGATAESHDAFRGEEGTFETAIRAAEHARDLGVSIQFNTTVTASTVEDLPEIADLVEKYDAAMWEVFFLIPVGRGEELEQLSPERAREVMEWLYRRGQDAPFRLITVEAPFYRRVARELQERDGVRGGPVGSTGAGNGFVFVSHTGEVYPSGFMPLSAGNVQNTPLPEIYQESPTLQQLRDRNSFNGPCGDCPVTEECGGSRSRAYAATGDPLGSDPLCPWAVADD